MLEEEGRCGPKRHSISAECGEAGSKGGGPDSRREDISPEVGQFWAQWRATSCSSLLPRVQGTAGRRDAEPNLVSKRSDQ